MGTTGVMSGLRKVDLGTTGVMSGLRLSGGGFGHYRRDEWVKVVRRIWALQA